MGTVDQPTGARRIPFNSPVETGLRELAVLTEAHPEAYDLQRILLFDYLVVHSADMPGGPDSLHPPTPLRSGEILVRRKLIEQGLILYWSRGLVERRFETNGFLFAATERAAAFLDSLVSPYTRDLRSRARWVVESLGALPPADLAGVVAAHVGEWGAEFEFESVLREES